MAANISVISSHRLAARSGDTTTVAAGTASAGFIAAVRWGSTSGVKMRITSAQVGMIVTTGFTGAQLIGYDLVIGRTYTASSSGGTAITLTTGNTKMRAATDSTRLTDARIATTAALTAGTVTPDATIIGADSVWTLAATAGAGLNHQYDFTDSECGGLILAQDEGIILRNLVLQGAAGTTQFFLELAYDEVLIV